MKIILVGGGKVGTALARQLSEEGHNVTVVDTNKARVEHLTESYDVLGIVGNGSPLTNPAPPGGRPPSPPCPRRALRMRTCSLRSPARTN